MTQENGFYLGCNLPHDPALTGEGWEWRCNTGQDRVGEIEDTYRELGFEVRLVPADVDGLSEACSGCKESLCAFSAVYVRKRSPASASD